MTVTQIQEASKTRSKVYIDSQFAFVLYKGELHKYRIKEGQEIREEDYRVILREVLPRRAKLRCMNLLKSRSYTEQQLRLKLKQGFYPEEVIDEAIAYIASFHYIDDLGYALDYIREKAESKGRHWIERQLLVKGVDRDVIRQAFCQWEAQGGGQDEQAVIAELLEKKHVDPGTADWKEKRKAYAYLLRRGFSPESAERALRADEMYDL